MQIRIERYDCDELRSHSRSETRSRQRYRQQDHYHSGRAPERGAETDILIRYRKASAHHRDDYSADARATERAYEYDDEQQTREWAERLPEQEELICADIMTEHANTCRRTTTLKELLRLLRESEAASLPVLDEEDRVVGIISDRDIALNLPMEKSRGWDALTAGDIMRTDLLRVRPYHRVIEAIEPWRNRRAAEILVTDEEDRLKGIITMTDILMEAVHNRTLARAIAPLLNSKARPRS